MKRRTSLIVGLSVLALLGAAPEFGTHFFTVEYMKPVGGVSELRVTFYGHMKKEDAARIVRAQLEAAVAVDAGPPLWDIVGSAWFHAADTTSYDDKRIDLDPELMYSKADGKIEPAKR